MVSSRLSPVHTRHDEEDSRPPGSSSHQPAQPEDDRPLELLDYLDNQEEGEGEGHQDQEEGDDGEESGAEHWSSSLAVLVCKG